MKANRKFVQADDAVSPVIAVILMVAITVVLAATVFVLVSDIGSNTSKNAPAISWSESESDDNWKISQAPNSVKWTDFEIKASDAAAGYLFGAAITAAADCGGAGGCDIGGADTYEAVSGATGNLEGGQSLYFCGSADTTFTLRHVPTNSVANDFSFASLTACP